MYQRVDESEKLLICGDLNGHVGAEVDGFEGVYGGFGFRKRNVEGEMILEFADALNLAVANTWFVKDEGKLITYENRACRTVVDYILVRKTERKLIRVEFNASSVRNGALSYGKTTFPSYIP